MKNRPVLILAVVIIGCLCFTGCKDPTKPDLLTSVESVEKYLAEQNGTDPDKPVQLVPEIDASEWKQLFAAIDRADKYVALDLTQCSNIPSEFSGSNYGEKIVSLILPAEITAIDEGACYNWTSLKEINLPAGITSINEGVFYGCTSLEQITLPAITSIGRAAFAGCTSLKQITLPANLTTIGERAFGGCTALREIDIPASVTTIGVEAFVGCSNLTKLICRAETPPELVIDNMLHKGGQFDRTASDFWIGVTNDSYYAYKAAWSEYADNIAVAGGLY